MPQNSKTGKYTQILRKWRNAAFHWGFAQGNGEIPHKRDASPLFEIFPNMSYMPNSAEMKEITHIWEMKYKSYKSSKLSKTNQFVEK